MFFLVVLSLAGFCFASDVVEVQSPHYSYLLGTPSDVTGLPPTLEHASRSDDPLSADLAPLDGGRGFPLVTGQHASSHTLSSTVTVLVEAEQQFRPWTHLGVVHHKITDAVIATLSSMGPSRWTPALSTATAT